MAKGKRVKNKMRAVIMGDNYKDAIKFCELSGLPYKLIESNYQLTIESDFYNATFMQEQKGKRAFVAGAMIKKDIAATGLVPPDIDQEDLVWFNFTMPERLKSGKHTIYNIDLKSAYATILRNHDLVSKKTFGYMSRLSKADRLMCVGMLAAKKEVYHMVGDKVIELEIIELETKNWFYFCVMRTNDIINECRKIIGSGFLFYWVDGIFFDNKEVAEKVGALLTKMGYKYSYDVCENFQYIESEKNRRIEYDKGEDHKVLSLPKKNEKIHEFLIKFLKFHNKQK